MRIVVEPHIEHRTASSPAATEKFEPYLSTLAAGIRHNLNPNVAEARFGLPRQMSHDEPQRAARFGGELPTPQATLIFDVVSHQHRTDSRCPQRLIGRPFQCSPIRTTDQQYTPPVDEVLQAGGMERVIVDDDHQRSIVAHCRTRGSKRTKRCSHARLGCKPLDERAAAKSATGQDGVERREATRNDVMIATDTVAEATNQLSKLCEVDHGPSPPSFREKSAICSLPLVSVQMYSSRRHGEQEPHP